MPTRTPFFRWRIPDHRGGGRTHVARFLMTEAEAAVRYGGQAVKVRETPAEYRNTLDAGEIDLGASADSPAPGREPIAPCPFCGSGEVEERYALQDHGFVWPGCLDCEESRPREEWARLVRERAQSSQGGKSTV
jgi:hypothetical protein